MVKYDSNGEVRVPMVKYDSNDEMTKKGHSKIIYRKIPGNSSKLIFGLPKSEAKSPPMVVAVLCLLKSNNSSLFLVIS